MRHFSYSKKLHALLAAALLALAALPAAADENEDTGKILVSVSSAENRRPLAGVEVTLEPRAGDSRSAVTSADGEAEFIRLDPGIYAVTATADARVAVAEPSIRVVRRKTTPVRLELRAADPLDEVVVVARGLDADLTDPVSASYRNREELRSAVGTGSDVMRALDGLPGLVSTGDFANFSVRGRGPRDNLIFVDGLPFDKVVHFDQTLGEEEDIGGGGRFSIFAPNSIVGAEFSPGGWRAAFGGRSGSLLQLEVAGGTPTPAASLRVDIAGVEFGYEGPSGLRDDTTMFVSARRFDFGRVFDLIDEQDIGQPELTDVVLKTATELDTENSIELLAIWAPEEYVRDIDNVLASPDFEDVALLQSEQDLGLVGLTWRRLVGDAGEWTNRLYFRFSDKLSSEGEAYPDLVPEGTPAGEIPVRAELLTVAEEEQELGWRSDFVDDNRFGEYRAGVRIWSTDVDYRTTLREDWDRFVYRSSDPRPPGQQFITLTPENVNSALRESETSYAAYADQVFEMGDVDLRTGLRFDYDGFADESLLSPRLAVNWRPAPERRISASAGVYYQSPRFLVRAASVDNFGLRNERTLHFSIGYEQRVGADWSLLVEPYYQVLDDLVVAQGRSTGRASNDGEGTNLGLDVVLSRRFANGWTADATYSFNDARRDDNDGTGEYDADFNRRNFFSVGGSWEINSRWKVGARWKYGTGRPTDDFIIHADVLGAGEPLRYSKELTQRNALRFDDYHSLNMRVDYRRQLGPVDLVGFVDVINVYGGPGGGSIEFNPRRGVNVSEEGEAFPIIGIIFERTW
jgi:hypothetical protein